MSKYERLRELKPNDIEYFNLTGKKFVGKVCEVFNGNTCDVILLLGNIVLKFKCTLTELSFDDDEGKTALIKNTMDVRLLGVENEQEIKEIEKDNHKLVYVICGKFDKNNLLEVSLYDLDNEEISINHRMKEYQ